MALKRLGDMNYSHLKVDRDSSDDEVNEPLLQDLQKAGQSADVVITITTAKTGHPDKEGKSRHGKQTAVDIALLDGVGSGGATNSTNGNEDFREKGNKVKDALISMGYVWNVEVGNDKAFLWQTNTGGNHYNHIHVSNRTGEPSQIDPQIDVTVDIEDEEGKEKKVDSVDFFKGLSQKEKDKVLGDLLSVLHTENTEKKKRIIQETLRIKSLMK